MQNPGIADFENALLAAIFGLNDNEWEENWDFLVHTMLHLAEKRIDSPDPRRHRGLDGAGILERIVTQRAKLADKKDLTIDSIVTLQMLVREYVVNHRWEDMLRVSKLHLQEVQKLTMGKIPEQSSNACMNMAVAANMLGRGQEAEKYVDEAWNYMTQESLPPHRFKEQLYRLIERAHHHLVLDKPDESGAINLLDCAFRHYQLLIKDIPLLAHDHPFDSILATIQDQMQKDFEKIAQQEKMEKKIDSSAAKQEYQLMQKLHHVFTHYVQNPNSTPAERIQALQKLLDSVDLEPQQRAKLALMIRRMRVLNSLGTDYKLNLNRDRSIRYREN